MLNVEKIKTIAALFGLALYEKFTVSSMDETVFMFNENGLVCVCDNNKIVNAPDYVLKDMLDEDISVEKLVYTLVVGKEYYFIDSYGVVIKKPWTDGACDLARYNCGNCFRLYEDAEKAAVRIREIFSEDKHIEVTCIA